MDCIKSLHIEGFKKFIALDITFNEHMNILVGENEAGKSTILEAIKTVLNQQYRNADKAILKELFNTQMVADFKLAPSVRTLPYILIEVQFDLCSKHKNAEYYYGENYGKRGQSKQEKYGITFECKFDEEIGSDLYEEILEGKIPYEYYSMRWTTFAGNTYQIIKKALNFLAIDTSSNNKNMSFNYYNRMLFSSIYDEKVQMSAKNTFREQLELVFDATKLPAIDDRRKFGIDSKKVALETILSIYEDAVALENRGSGMESLIKTQIALDRRKSRLDVILMEEPENHLCFTSLKNMLHQISEQQEKSQIIVATHSNMIASSLNLKNVLWIKEDKVRSLSYVDKEVAAFFVKAADNNFLQLLLSEKVILVEGATEFLLLPHFYKQIRGHSIEQDGVSIISCNGISYKNYLKIAGETEKRIVVITDNDKKQKRIDVARAFNDANNLQHIYMGHDVIDWTWEACVYHINKAELDGMIIKKEGADYKVHGEVCESEVLGKMLNNKVETAYKMLISDKTFKVPQYVKDAILWLNG